MTISVMLVDDSAVARQVMTKLLTEAGNIEVIATAHDPIFAMQKVQKQRPDVIVLDIEMPRMDGLTYLKKIMSEDPIPVVICSTLTKKTSKTSVEALALGAVSVVEKPSTNIAIRLSDSAKQIVEAVRTAAKVNAKKLSQQVSGRVPTRDIQAKMTADVMLPRRDNLKISSSKLVAIGASTGGTVALENILSNLPAHSPPMVVVQHIQENFTTAFAERMNSISEMHIREAVDGDEIQPGLVLIAPGGKHTMVENRNGSLRVAVRDGMHVSRHKPSVDVLFRSVAQSSGRNALGIILTGMGDDGANGLKEMRDAGAHTLGQDENSCVVYGMPAVAMERGAVEKEISLQGVATAILTFARRM